MKVKDFNGCWCEATEENYDGLIRLGLKTNNKLTNNSKVIWIVGSYFSIYTCTLKDATDGWRNLKQIHLLDREWYYIENSGQYFKENEPQSNLSVTDDTQKDYIEIDENFTIQARKLYQHKDGGIYEVTSVLFNDSTTPREDTVWYRSTNNDREYCRTISHFRESFKPYKEKKEWWNDKKNIGKMVIAGGGIPCIFRGLHSEYYMTLIDLDTNKTIFRKLDEVRPATKEEVLSLLIEI